jgi:hypothetical protein
MSEQETFLTRWSRLKRQGEREAQVDDAAAAALPSARHPARQAGDAAVRTPPGNPQPAFDPATLPPIESITAGTDIRAFLQSGVPAELTRAALRRVWSTDPAIRDFIGIAENQWDFTDPTAIPGFGPLQASDDVGKLVARAMDGLGETAERMTETTAVGDDQAAASSVRRSIAQSGSAPTTVGIQEAGMPSENHGDPQPAAEPSSEKNRVDVAARDDMEPAERHGPSHRRGHGSALPQ